MPELNEQEPPKEGQDPTVSLKLKLRKILREKKRDARLSNPPAQPKEGDVPWN